MTKGKLIIISAPSGCGKSTIIGELVKDNTLGLEFSISATTRPPRRGEQNGVNYYFLSLDQFQQAIANNELVEYEEVYPGGYYGTLKSEIERIRKDGKNVILDIDVKGGINVKNQFGNEAISVFIKPPCIDTLRHRLLSRGTDPIESINVRLEKAKYELSFAPQFDFEVVNDVLIDAINHTRDIISIFINKDK